MEFLITEKDGTAWASAKMQLKTRLSTSLKRLDMVHSPHYYNQMRSSPEVVKFFDTKKAVPA